MPINHAGSVAALRLLRFRNGVFGGARFVFAAGMAPPGQGPNNQFLVEALTLMLDQNSLEDIRHTRGIHQVYLGGKLLDRNALAEKIR